MKVVTGTFSRGTTPSPAPMAVAGIRPRPSHPSRSPRWAAAISQVFGPLRDQLMKRLLLLFLIAPALLAQTATVNWTSVHQQIDGFGLRTSRRAGACQAAAGLSAFFSLVPTYSGQLRCCCMGQTDAKISPHRRLRSPGSAGSRNVRALLSWTSSSSAACSWTPVTNGSR